MQGLSVETWGKVPWGISRVDLHQPRARVAKAAVRGREEVVSNTVRPWFVEGLLLHCRESSLTFLAMRIPTHDRQEPVLPRWHGPCLGSLL